MQPTMLGTSTLPMHPPHRWDCKQSIEAGVGATIDGVRAKQPTVPIAVVTPTLAYYEGTTRCRGGFTVGSKWRPPSLAAAPQTPAWLL